jgi:hypothetical protein
MVNAEAALVGQNVTSAAALANAVQALVKDVGSLPAGTDHQRYKLECAQTLLYKFVLGLQPALPPQLSSAITPFKRAVSTGHQTYQVSGAGRGECFSC